MFAQICVFLSALIAGDVTLANGIRFVDLPARTDSFEMILGYQVENGPLASMGSEFLLLTPSARAIALATYGAGGQVELLLDQNRTGIRISGPLWLKPLIERETVKFFSETPEQNPKLIERVVVDARFGKPPDFRRSVENELRAAVLGGLESASNNSSVGADQFIEFFRNNYGVDHAFVLSSTPLAGLEEIPARKSVRGNSGQAVKAAAKREFRYKPDLPVGAVIFESPTPAVYYEGWYAALFLDRLIRRTVPNVSTSLAPSIESGYYQLEVPVPQGQFDDVVEGRFIEDLDRLQSTYVKTEIFEAARADAIQYLESAVALWFRSLGIDDRRLEGIERLRAFAPDDIRAAMRDVLMDHVVASWSPKPRQTTIEVEALDAPKPQLDVVARPELPELNPVPIPVFPTHSHEIPAETAPERLASGVTVASSSNYAVFVAPTELKVFDREPTTEDLKNYAAFRPQRILVMAPPNELARIKDLWSSFTGNPRDTEAVASIGSVANVDLPALMILKMALDRRLLEFGLWDDIQVEIKAGEGSQLTIHGSDEGRQRVSSWIKELAQQGLTDDEFAWAREAAIHHLAKMLPDLQSLFWQRDKVAPFPNVQAVTAMDVQEAARIYF